MYAIHKPETPLPLIFDSPHSGAIIPEDFRFSCGLDDLEKTQDKFIDDLFAAAPEYGATLLCALFPRQYIDANRAIDDIDPKLLAGDWPYGAINPTGRSDAGIGLVWRLARPGVPIYDAPLSAEAIKHRIEGYYVPYHKALESLIEEAHYNFGQIWHINCHSMPAASACPKRPQIMHGNAPKAADFCLGNLDGTSCDLEFTRQLRSFLQGLGYHVTVNDPFKGVEILHRHGDPARGRNVLQLEINRALYMDEETGEKNKNYNILKADLEKMIRFCADYAQARLTSQAAD